MSTVTLPDPPPRHRPLEWLRELLFGVELNPPLSCPSCHWTHHRARLTALRLLAEGRAVRCTWCAKPMTQKPTQ